MNSDQTGKKSLGQKIKGLFGGKDKQAQPGDTVIHQETHQREVIQKNVYQDADKLPSHNQVIVPPGPAIVPAVVVPITNPAPAQPVQQSGHIQPANLPQMHDPLYNSHQIIRGVTPPVEPMVTGPHFVNQMPLEKEMRVSTHIESAKAPIPSGKPLLTQAVEDSNRVHNTLYVPGGDIQQFNAGIPPIIKEREVRAQQKLEEDKKQAEIEVAKEEARIEAEKANQEIPTVTSDNKPLSSGIISKESNPLYGPSNPNLRDPLGSIVESQPLRRDQNLTAAGTGPAMATGVLTADRAATRDLTFGPASKDNPVFMENLPKLKQDPEYISRHLAESNPAKPKPFDVLNQYGKIPNPAYAGGKPFLADILRHPDPFKQEANPLPHQHVPLHVIGERNAEIHAMNQSNKIPLEERKETTFHSVEKKTIM